MDWRNLLDSEASDLDQLLSILGKVYLSLDREDERLLWPDPRGQFWVKSFYDDLNGGQNKDGKDWLHPEF